MNTDRPAINEMLNNLLHVAAAKKDGRSEVAWLVEENDVNVNLLHTETQMTAIEYAAQSGSQETVLYLLQKGAQIASRKKTDNNLLDYAAQDSLDVEKIKFIASLYNEFKDETTALHAAIVCRNKTAVAGLCREDPYLMYKTNNRNLSAYSLALHMNYPDMALFLLDFSVCGIGNDETLLIDMIGAFRELTKRHLFTLPTKAVHLSVIQKLLPLVKESHSLNGQMLRLGMELYVEFLGPIIDNKKILVLLRSAFSLSQQKTADSEWYGGLKIIFEDLERHLDTIDIQSELFPLMQIHLSPTKIDLIESEKTKEDLTKFIEVLFTALLTWKDRLPKNKHLFDKVVELAAIKNVEVLRLSSTRSLRWLDEIIIPLFQRDEFSCELSYACLKLFLKISSKSAAEEHKDAKKIMLMMAVSLRNTQPDLTFDIFKRFFMVEDKWELKKAYDIITATQHLTQSSYYHSLINASALNTENNFMLRVKILLINPKEWEQSFLLLNALYEHRVKKCNPKESPFNAYFDPLEITNFVFRSVRVLLSQQIHSPPQIANHYKICLQLQQFIQQDNSTDLTYLKSMISAYQQFLTPRLSVDEINKCMLEKITFDSHPNDDILDNLQQIYSISHESVKERKVERTSTSSSLRTKKGLFSEYKRDITSQSEEAVEQVYMTAFNSIKTIEMQPDDALFNALQLIASKFVCPTTAFLLLVNDWSNIHWPNLKIEIHRKALEIASTQKVEQSKSGKCVPWVSVITRPLMSRQTQEGYEASKTQKFPMHFLSVNPVASLADDESDKVSESSEDQIEKKSFDTTPLQSRKTEKYLAKLAKERQKTDDSFSLYTENESAIHPDKSARAQREEQQRTMNRAYLRDLLEDKLENMREQRLGRPQMSDAEIKSKCPSMSSTYIHSEILPCLQNKKESKHHSSSEHLAPRMFSKRVSLCTHNYNASHKHRMQRGTKI